MLMHSAGRQKIPTRSKHPRHSGSSRRFWTVPTNISPPLTRFNDRCDRAANVTYPIQIKRPDGRPLCSEKLCAKRPPKFKMFKVQALLHTPAFEWCFFLPGHCAIPLKYKMMRSPVDVHMLKTTRCLPFSAAYVNICALNLFTLWPCAEEAAPGGSVGKWRILEVRGAGGFVVNWENRTHLLFFERKKN